MGRRETRRKVVEPLRRAGLEVLEGGVPEGVLPVFAVGVATSCGRDTGRRDTYIDLDDADGPELVAREPRLARTGHLQRPVRHRPGVPARHARPCPPLPGSRAGRPEFAMLALDSSVSLVGTTWQHGIGCLAVPEPSSTAPVRRILDWAVNGADAPPHERA
ncbi:hypothetical protein LG634_26235 [Streptomyces bambusae]|uniref:hypothetical protein n=1 Tax=Streptomyces bambusae TaxID=1550616 RepID=UPI001CFD615B|nr:hypothetical protein [Streptomyces bambusae]MCB5168312.1 hypothetical protein [Streptomyces bambusae]